MVHGKIRLCSFFSTICVYVSRKTFSGRFFSQVQYNHGFLELCLQDLNRVAPILSPQMNLLPFGHSTTFPRATPSGKTKQKIAKSSVCSSFLLASLSWRTLNIVPSRGGLDFYSGLVLMQHTVSHKEPQKSKEVNQPGFELRVLVSHDGRKAVFNHSDTNDCLIIEVQILRNI